AVRCPAGGDRCAAFFFSSRRRHTRSKRDWSSDVCSSDLTFFARISESKGGVTGKVSSKMRAKKVADALRRAAEANKYAGGQATRSEERRVGKDSDSKWAQWRREKR